MTARNERFRPAAEADARAGLDAAEGASPLDGLDLAGGGAEATRAGEDTRRRGWFWHWNSIVTQYAPLLGLKGVGLLNSYTVWTDRREESPHRGYAFPSQQSEADFYGEDRAELIAINKILVALDLIEIRKEMVVRADEQGRRWRVPHNFYRVKDHADGFGLTARDVLKVAELADRDQTVYRYVRRVFSPRFSPIDGDNVWHRILPEIRQIELWQRLAARTASEEDRASARTRAGHAARRTSRSTRAEQGLAMPGDGDTATPNDSRNATTTDASIGAAGTVVAATNTGSEPDVDETNEGLMRRSATSVGPGNEGTATAVEPSNRTYDQENLTTTTTRRTDQKDRSMGLRGEPDRGTGSPQPVDIDRTVADRDREEGTVGARTPLPHGPGDRLAPADGPGEAAAIRAFEAANARVSTPAERTLLRGLAERFDPAARGQGDRTMTGWEWLAAAAYEAVESGSSFVAPRRLREILARWERDGFPGDASTASRPASPGDGGDLPRARRGRAGETADPAAAASDPVAEIGTGPDLRLPHGYGSLRTWAFTVGLLAGAIDRETLAELVRGTAIAGYRDGEVSVGVPDPHQAERLATHRELIGRKLGEAMRRPVRVAFLVPAGTGDAPPPPAREGIAPTPANPSREGERVPARPVASFTIVECGLPSGKVWAAVLAEVEERSRVSRANVDAWLRSTRLIGRDGEGAAAALIVGVPHALAQRRISSRFLPDLTAAVQRVVGAALPVEVVVEPEWLAARGAPAPLDQHRTSA